MRELPAPLVHRHAAEPFLRLLVTGEDAMQRHHLEVVLVRADTEVRRAAKRLAWLEVVGNKQVSGMGWQTGS